VCRAAESIDSSQTVHIPMRCVLEGGFPEINIRMVSVMSFLHTETPNTLLSPPSLSLVVSHASVPEGHALGNSQSEAAVERSALRNQHSAI